MEPSPSPNGMDKILRFARAQREGASAANARDDRAAHTGQAALDVVQQVAAAIRANEVRTETIVARAIEELKAAEARIRALEARALEAETRANEAEKWLHRLHQAIQEKLADWGGKGARAAGARHLAA
jgi:DNA primase large subunit